MTLKTLDATEVKALPLTGFMKVTAINGDGKHIDFTDGLINIGKIVAVADLNATRRIYLEGDTVMDVLETFDEIIERTSPILFSKNEKERIKQTKI